MTLLEARQILKRNGYKIVREDVSPIDKKSVKDLIDSGSFDFVKKSIDKNSNELNSNNYKWYASTDGEGTTGLMSVATDSHWLDNYIHFSTLESIKKGAGSELMDYLIKEAKKEGWDGITLQPHNEGLYDYYAKWGFERIEVDGCPIMKLDFKKPLDESKKVLRRNGYRIIREETDNKYRLTESSFEDDLFYEDYIDEDYELTTEDVLKYVAHKIEFESIKIWNVKDRISFRGGLYCSVYVKWYKGNGNKYSILDSHQINNTSLTAGPYSINCDFNIDTCDVVITANGLKIKDGNMFIELESKDSWSHILKACKGKVCFMNRKKGEQ